jgi:hypothetical protein
MNVNDTSAILQKTLSAASNSSSNNNLLNNVLIFNISCSLLPLSLECKKINTKPSYMIYGFGFRLNRLLYPASLTFSLYFIITH